MNRVGPGNPTDPHQAEHFASEKFRQKLTSIHPLLARQGKKAWWLVSNEPAAQQTGQWRTAVIGKRGAEVFVFKVDSGKTPALRFVCFLPAQTAVLVLEAGNKPPWWRALARIGDDGRGLDDVGVDGLKDADELDAPDAIAAAWIQIADPMPGWIRMSSLVWSDELGDASSAPQQNAHSGPPKLMGHVAARTALLRAMAKVRANVVSRNPMDACVRAAAGLLEVLIDTFTPAEESSFSTSEIAELAGLGVAFGADLGGYSWPPRQVDGAFRKDGADCPWWPPDYEGHFGHTFLVFDPAADAEEGSGEEEQEEESLDSLTPWFCKTCCWRSVESVNDPRTPALHAWRVSHTDKVAVREVPKLDAPIVDILCPGDLVHQLALDLPTTPSADDRTSGGVGGDGAHLWIALVGGGWVLTDASGPPLRLGRLLQREQDQDASTFTMALAHALRAGRRGAHAPSMRGRCAECGCFVFEPEQRPQLPRGWGGLPRQALICDVSADQFDRSLPRLMLVEPLGGGAVTSVRRRYELRRARALFDGQIRMRHAKLFAEHEGGGGHMSRTWGDTLRELAMRSELAGGGPCGPGAAPSGFKPHRAHGRHRYSSKAR